MHFDNNVWCVCFCVFLLIQIDMPQFTVRRDDAPMNQSDAAAAPNGRHDQLQTNRQLAAITQQRPQKPRHRLRTTPTTRRNHSTTATAIIMHHSPLLLLQRRRPQQHQLAVRTLMLFLLLRLCDAMPGSSTNFKISPKPCVGNSYAGTCMFVWECIKSEGQHVGMCMDSFMFGSCCAHNLTDNIVMPQHIDYRPSKPLVTHHHGTKYKPSAAMTSHMSSRWGIYATDSLK